MAQRGLPPIVDLLRSGHAYIKLSAPFRISQGAPNYDDVRPLVRHLAEANPARIVCASDEPGENRPP